MDYCGDCYGESEDCSAAAFFASVDFDHDVIVPCVMVFGCESEND